MYNPAMKMDHRKDANVQIIISPITTKVDHYSSRDFFCDLL